MPLQTQPEEVKIGKCPIHKDAPTAGCPNCILYMRTQAYHVERGLFIKDAAPAPVVATPVDAKPAAAPSTATDTATK